MSLSFSHVVRDIEEIDSTDFLTSHTFALGVSLLPRAQANHVQLQGIIRDKGVLLIDSTASPG